MVRVIVSESSKAGFKFDTETIYFAGWIIFLASIIVPKLVCVYESFNFFLICKNKNKKEKKSQMIIKLTNSTF